MFRMNAVRVPLGFFGRWIVSCLISRSLLFVSTNLVLSLNIFIVKIQSIGIRDNRLLA